MIERIARAKINLALHVTGRREDGYHLLDTLAGFADFGDLLRFEPAPDGQISLKITGPFAAEPGLSGEDNIVASAARLLAQAADIPAGAAITLEKNLPVASGIGGGSADAAAALLGLRELWQVADDIALEPLAMRLGADVPMCLVSAPLRARGIGEVVEPLAGAQIVSRHRRRTGKHRAAGRLPAGAHERIGCDLLRALRHEGRGKRRAPRHR